MPHPFYNVVLDGSATDRAPLMRLRATDAVEPKIGSKIPVLLSSEGDPPTLGGMIASIDDFAKLDGVRKQAAIEKLREYRHQSLEAEIVGIEADSEPDCLGRLVVREVAPPAAAG